MKSITRRYWKKPKPITHDESIRSLAKEFKVTPEFIYLLGKRGVKGRRSIKEYLFPTLQELADPFLMKDMERACELAAQTLTTGGDVIIWGDYDVDGVTATALLYRFFKQFPSKIHWFIPNRFDHGYGLDKIELHRLVDNAGSEKPLLVTVDCGITNYDEVAYAKKLGCTVIITDHHEPGENKLLADAVLNIKQEHCDFPDKNLAGVGVAFYLAMGIRSYLNRFNYFTNAQELPNMKKLLDLVAVGTIADMVELKGLNRVFVKAGFEILNGSPSTGLAALLKETDIHTGDITSEDIAFQIAPKINAAGRMAEANIALQLLIEEDPREAQRIARNLTLLNNNRKNLCTECLENTLTKYYNNIDIHKYCVILKAEYSIGVLGVVASQMADKLKKPIIVVAENNDKQYGKVLKGSCRSVNGIDILAALKSSEEYLLQYGGHKMAAGITLYEEELDKLVKAISTYLQNTVEVEPEFEEIDIEIEVEKALTKSYLHQLQMFEPFGVGNAKPIFIERDVVINEIKRIGKMGDHLTFISRGNYNNNKCIGFKFGEYEEELRSRQSVDLVYTVSISRFKRSVMWQAQVVDIL